MNSDRTNRRAVSKLLFLPSTSAGGPRDLPATRYEYGVGAAIIVVNQSDRTAEQIFGDIGSMKL